MSRASGSSRRGISVEERGTHRLRILEAVPEEQSSRGEDVGRNAGGEMSKTRDGTRSSAPGAQIRELGLSIEVRVGQVGRMGAKVRNGHCRRVEAGWGPG